MLDHLSAGGLPAGMAPTICAVKELAEEAGVPEKYSEENIKSVSCVSYRMFYKECVKRDVLFCYDLELGESFVPKPVDGEVESFELLPLERVCEIIAFEPGRFKPNCVLVIIDFAIRKGIVTCDMPGFPELVKALRR
jgi:8-oxo-dGTP pyrophosphatase MutT (NUDIX family)